MEWNLGMFLWTMLALLFWFTVAWTFVCVLADILRRDMSGRTKAGWVLLIVLLPLAGALAYLATRPRGGPALRPVPGAVVREVPADRIPAATAMHHAGRLSTADYERLKRQAALRARSA